MYEIRVKRAYDPPAPTDGFRVLVDRLWPRGLKKETARIDLWLQDIAPSDRLRRWFGHDPKRFPVFRERYRRELEQNTDALRQLLDVARSHPVVTLLYGTRDPLHNQAVVLREFVREQLARQSHTRRQP
ncbi:MAG: hypothetical protein KatS3mg077_1608 [Candidatus Binatia bacterium]|nr:MAG: hypothetical protein KatS3mg077_1608 [Candidatus Binatia bacterium]